MTPKTDNRFVKIPLTELETPSDGQEVIANSWWAYKDGHVLGYKVYGPMSKYDPAPQANKLRSVAEKLTQNLYPGYDVIFVPAAFWPPRRKTEEKK